MDAWILWPGALVFATISAAVWALLQRVWPETGTRRLQRNSANRAGPDARLTDRLPRGVLALLTRLSRWSLDEAACLVTHPESTLRTSALRPPLALQLLQAGWRSSHALSLYGGSKTLLVVALPLFGAALGRPVGLPASSLSWWFALLAAASLGWVLPDLLLRWQRARRQAALFRSFPDALDLLRICVQAGLGLDAAIERVGREMRLASPILSEEWRLTGLELRAGASRALALRHLADRVGLADIDALVAMLIQADRFGTRMAEALQIHADALRTQRRLRAEENAAKLPVKLLIPLVFCIFPALLTVMLGPVGLHLHHHFSQPV